MSGRRSQGGRSDLRGINAGATRAPLWGNRRRWYPHAVTPGFFDTAIEEHGLDAFRDEVDAAIGEAVREVFG